MPGRIERGSRARPRVVAAAAAAVALAALLPGAAAGQSGDAAPAGARVFSSHCAACHQAGGTGVPGMIPPLAGSEWVAGEPEWIVRIVLHGLEGPIEVDGETYDGMMPPFGGMLDDARIADVLTYVRSNFGNDAPPVTAEEVARIRAATASRKAPWTADELLRAKAENKASSSR